MGTRPVVCAFLLLSAPAARAAEHASGPVNRVYGLAEGISDGVYDIAVRGVLAPFLPRRLMEGLKAAPERGSQPLFDRNLAEKETRFLDRARFSYPLSVDDHPVDPALLTAWRDWVAAEQVRVAVDSFKDTMLQRYELDVFADSPSLGLRRPRDAGEFATAGVIGAAFLYLNGLHATTHWGVLKLGVDVAPGLGLMRSFRGGRPDRHAAALELGLRGFPLTAGTEWSATAGGLRAQLLTVHYRVRF